MIRLLYLLFLSLTVASSTPNFLSWARGALADSRCYVSTRQDELDTDCDESDSRIFEAELTIQEYLKANKSSTGKFYVQGWRWHTLSLVRDAKRLGGLAQRLADAKSNGNAPNRQFEPLLQAIDFVVDFNMKGLHKIEADLFIPWMRQTIHKISNQPMAKAFTELLDQLDQDRIVVAQMGRSLRDKAIRASTASTNDEIRREVLRSIQDDALRIADRTRAMFRLQDTLLVPTVASIVPEAEQKSFNNKVLLSLGILDSRTHLVGMYDTVCEMGDELEHQLFQEFIPYLPRLMIPRWKRLLYEPKAGALDPSMSL